MRKITVSEDPALTARIGPSTVPTRITAILTDGQRIVREVDDVPGFRRPANEPSRRRAEIPRQYRQALAGAADGRHPPSVVGAR